jgi:hypothetical protein
MSDYYLRSTTADWPELLNLGVLLGEISIDEQGNPHGNGFVVVNHTGHVYKPTGETAVVDGETVALTAPVLAPDGQPYMHANLRTTQDLGATVAGKIAYLQNQIVKELEMAELPPDEDEETGEIVDTRPYYLNRVARMESDVAKWQETLSNLGKYFLLDEEGKPRTPADPAWVFA